jgi:ABC-type multidrug transport system fused ATPase/permease subunit
MFLIFSICAMGIYFWLVDSITTGAIALGLGLSLRVMGMSHWIMWEISALFENIGTVQDGMSTLAKPQLVTDQPNAKPLLVTHGDIQLENVSFAYQRDDGSFTTQVFDNLNLHIRAGEKVGIVGRSGAGKSTLVNLLLRFYDIQSGRILIDGQDIAQTQQESLRNQIGMVTQDTSLLHRSVRENVMFGRPDADEAAMVNASKKAFAHDFIQDLSDSKGRQSYDAYVGERGVTLSGGQRQRIAIARVLLKDAPILILDEATSALDSEIELSIQQSFTELMADKTVIAIAHRLSTIAALDRLIVLDNGIIVEQGNHNELVNSGGLYSQLWSHQSGGFLGLE